MSLDLLDFGGYDYPLISPPPDTLVCKICRLPSRNPHMTLCCGHVFCMSCISKVEGNTCCICRATKRGQYKLYKNKQVERDVWSLQIYCPNKEKGCEWQGELKSVIESHLKPGGIDGCQYGQIKCSNGCGKMILRCHMRAHRNRCPLETIQCTYYGQGCKEKMARKDQSEHNKRNLEKHLALTTEALTSQISITQELAILKSDMAIIKQQLSLFLKSVQFMDTLEAGGYV